MTQLGPLRQIALPSTNLAKAADAVLYFEVANIDEAYTALQTRGIAFDSSPHLIHRDDTGTFGPAGTEEWMAFFKDPDGNILALASGRSPAGQTG
jgi:catechol 2,3-dioxygenase-like lactoylglutathione lyase family enzyme